MSMHRYTYAAGRRGGRSAVCCPDGIGAAVAMQPVERGSDSKTGGNDAGFSWRRGERNDPLCEEGGRALRAEPPDTCDPVGHTTQTPNNRRPLMMQAAEPGKNRPDGQSSNRQSNYQRDE